MVIEGMKILVVHNRYQHRGGEDVVFEEEVRLLREHGHEVVVFETSNDQLAHMGKLAMFCRTLWSFSAYRDVLQVIRESEPAIMHVHNTFPFLSPSIYYAASRAGVPVIQTLHNYRLLCANALFFRGGKACDLCLHTRTLWPGVRYNCYRGSRSATLSVVAMLVFHRILGTWRRKVKRYIVLTAFARDTFIQGGLPAARLHVRPNFTMDPGEACDHPRQGGVFVGMLHSWKGCDVLLSAWKRCKGAGELKVIGDGPLKEPLEEGADKRIVFSGAKDAVYIMHAIQRASFLVFPSLLYENMPRTVLEAMACGTPVIASDIGSIPEMVTHRETGLLFECGDVGSLAEQIGWASTHPAEMARMGQNARKDYLLKYTPEAAYRSLLAIYEEVLSEAKDTSWCGD